MKPSLILWLGLLLGVLAAACIRKEPIVICDPGQQSRPLKIIFRDSTSGINLITSGRYSVDSIQQVRYIQPGLIEFDAVKIDSSGGELGCLLRAGGIWQGCDMIYTPAAAPLDSIFMRLTATDEDTIRLASTAAGTVEVFYNGVLRATSPTLDESRQTLTIFK
jgi:hypothetical protein